MSGASWVDGTGEPRSCLCFPEAEGLLPFHRGSSGIPQLSLRVEPPQLLVPVGSPTEEQTQGHR